MITTMTARSTSHADTDLTSHVHSIVTKYDVSSGCRPASLPLVATLSGQTGRVLGDVSTAGSGKGLIIVCSGANFVPPVD